MAHEIIMANDVLRIHSYANHEEKFASLLHNYKIAEKLSLMRFVLNMYDMLARVKTLRLNIFEHTMFICFAFIAVDKVAIWCRKHKLSRNEYGFYIKLHLQISSEFL